MGCKLSLGDAAQRATNREIEAALKKSHSAEKSVIKILLLGTGEAGKSTIIKQMKIIHDNGFSDEEMAEGTRVLQGRLLQALVDVLNSGSLEEISPDDKEVLEAAGLDAQNTKLSTPVFEAFHRVLKVEKVKELMIPQKDPSHSLTYFMSHLERVMDDSFTLSSEDYLRLRQRTSGIMEYLFKVQCEITKGYPITMSFRMIDVGGQRSERKKWIHCFEGVHAILFIVSLAEYDQTLEEDSEMNRMQESLSLFQEIFHNKYFVKTGFILFLNKTDLFEEKIKTVPLSVCFPEFQSKGLEDSKNYILSKFMDKCSSAQGEKIRRRSSVRRPSRAGSTNTCSKSVYHHFTCATDTSHIRYIFSSVAEMIIRTTLERTQLI